MAASERLFCQPNSFVSDKVPSVSSIGCATLKRALVSRFSLVYHCDTLLSNLLLRLKDTGKTSSENLDLRAALCASRLFRERSKFRWERCRSGLPVSAIFNALSRVNGSCASSPVIKQIKRPVSNINFRKCSISQKLSYSVSINYDLISFLLSFGIYIILEALLFYFQQQR